MVISNLSEPADMSARNCSLRSHCCSLCDTKYLTFNINLNACQYTGQVLVISTHLQGVQLIITPIFKRELNRNVHIHFGIKFYL